MTYQEKHDRSFFPNIGDETTLEEYLPQLVVIAKAADEKSFQAHANLRKAQADYVKAREERDKAASESIHLEFILNRNRLMAEHEKRWGNK
jgi:hypothetical protein